MRIGIIVGLCVLLAGCAKSEAPADGSKPEAAARAAVAAPAVAIANRPEPPAMLNMDSIGELTKPDQFQGQLRGGTRIEDPSLYPASVYSKLGPQFCTATLIGPSTLLTAGHCARTGTVANFKLNGQPRTAVCTRESHYPADPKADYALCLVDGAAVAGVPFERVNTDPSSLKIGAQLRLTGFGCTKADGTGGNDGVYMVGDLDKIVALPSGTNNDIVTSGDTALCFGDSGGPAFLISGSQRWVVSVNSRAGQLGETLNDRSYLESTSAPIAVAFLTGWAQDHSQKICGLQAGPAGCR